MRLPVKAHEAHLLAIIVLYVLGFAVYLNTFPVPFVFDDFPNIRDNPSIRMTTLDLTSLSAAASESHALRRPVANISFALNYLVGRYDVKGYHLVNIFVHVANGILVYFITIVLLRRAIEVTHRQPASHRRLQLAALLAAGIFIVHPVQVQAVTYIVQRMTSMATMFCLLSLLLYLLGRTHRNATRRAVLLTSSLASWLLALGSKEIAATLPVIIVITEYVFYRDRDRRWPGISLWYPALALGATACVAYLYLSADPLAAITAQYADREFTMIERLLTQLRVLVFYLSLMLLPLPGRLGLEHAFTVSQSIVEPISTLVAAAVLVAMLVAALRFAQREPILSYSFLWFLITLAVESSIIGLELAFEHRLYFPMFGFALMAGYVASRVPATHATATIAGGIILVAALATITVMRNFVWQDPIRLWADTVSKNPESWRARNNLGKALLERGKLESAAREFEEAIRLEPGFAEPHNNLGAIHAQSERFEQAVSHFAAAIEANPRYAEAYNNLGVALLSQGRDRDAAMAFAFALDIAPRYARAHGNLSRALASMGKTRESCRHLRIALELDRTIPHSPEALASCPPNSKDEG